MSRLLLRTIILLVATVSGFHARSAAAAAESSAPAAVATSAALERATQALVDALARRRTAMPLDPPRGEAASALTDYAGQYALSDTTRQTIRLERDQLVADRPGRPLQLLLPETGDVFFTPGRARIRRIFTRAPNGQARGFAERREGTDLLWTRVAEDAAH